MLDIPFWTRVPRHQGSQITIHSIPIKYSLWLQWITFYWGLIQHYSTGPGGSAKGYIGQDAQPRGVKIKCHEPEPRFNVTVKRDKNCSSYLRSKVIKVIFITFPNIWYFCTYSARVYFYVTLEGEEKAIPFSVLTSTSCTRP